MIKKFLQRFVDPEVREVVRVETQVITEVRTVEIKVPDSPMVDPERRRLALLRVLQDCATQEVHDALNAFWGLYQIDAVAAAGPMESGERDKVIRWADAGHAVVLGCIELMDRLEIEIEDQKKILAERQINGGN